MAAVFQWIWANAIALAALVVSIFALIKTYVKDGRKLLVVASAGYSTEPGQEPTKTVTVYAVNKRQRTIQIHNVFYDLNHDNQNRQARFATWGAIDDATQQNQRLEDGQHLVARFKTLEFEDIVSIYATDSLGKKWHAPAWQLEAIRERRPERNPAKLTWWRKAALAHLYAAERRRLGIPKKGLRT